MFVWNVELISFSKDHFSDLDPLSPFWWVRESVLAVFGIKKMTWVEVMSGPRARCSPVTDPNVALLFQHGNKRWGNGLVTLASPFLIQSVPLLQFQSDNAVSSRFSGFQSFSGLGRPPPRLTCKNGHPKISAASPESLFRVDFHRHLPACRLSCGLPPNGASSRAMQSIPVTLDVRCPGPRNHN